jgi:hypothetical protein
LSTGAVTVGERLSMRGIPMPPPRFFRASSRNGGLDLRLAID